MTDREYFGLLCNKVFVRQYEKETAYQNEDAASSAEHKRRMREIIMTHSVKRRRNVRFMWVIAATLLLLVLLGGTIIALYRPFSEAIVSGGMKWAIETPSRILFFQNREGDWIENDYISGKTLGICYYNKADGNAYVYCDDPLCDHTSCPQRYFDVLDSFLIGDRMYTFDENDHGRAVIRSFGINDTDVRIDWNSEDHPDMKIEIYNDIEFSGFVYEQYLFIGLAFEDGQIHTLRFDTQTGIMEDLTAKTGNEFMPSFAYDDMLYRYSAEHGKYIKTDLSLSEITDAEEHVQKAFAKTNENGEKTRFIHTLSFGHRMYGTVMTEKENGEEESTIQVLDMNEGKVFQIPDASFGNDAKYVIYADGKYLYYLADEAAYLGFHTKYNVDIYNDYGGRIYRAKLDGSDAECIFEDPEMKFYAGTRAYISGDDFIIQAAKMTMKGDVSKIYASGIYIGHLNHEGTIDKLEYMEVIS